MSKTTHIIAILDRSGSMGMMQSEVISNFNNFLKEQQEMEGKAKLTLVLFDDRYEMLYDEVNIKDVAPLTSDHYFARGMTAMMDAIGRTLTEKMNKKKAIVLIHTDGAENSSKEYNQTTVKALVDKLKEKWEFIFVGADVDAKVGASYGINNNVQTINTVAGMADSYDVFSSATQSYRSAVTSGVKTDITAAFASAVAKGTTTTQA